MINDYESEIKTNSQILEALPKNNIKNKKKYLEELDKILAKTEDDKKNVLLEIERRYNEYNDLSINPELESINEEIKNQNKKTHLLNQVITSYEKSGLDRILYFLDHFYQGSFKAVNDNILMALAKFTEVGIDLNINDFNYTLYTRIYMQEIMLKKDAEIDNNKMKEIFDSIYWKSPDIIKHITINFKNLYYKYKKKFDIYFNNQKLLLEKENPNYLEDFINLKAKHKYLISTDEYLIKSKFLNRIYDFKDYTEEQITKDYHTFISEAVEITDNIKGVVLELSKSLEEYKFYLKYKYIIDEIRVLFKDKDKNKKASITKKKELDKLEKNILKTSKKASKLILKSSEKAEILNSKLNAIINDVDKLYDEYEESLILEQIAVLNDSVTLYDALNIGIANYNFIIKLMEKHDSEITLEEINKNLDEINTFLVSNKLSMLKSLYLIEEKDVSLVLIDKYNLYGLNIKIESLTDDNVDNFIKVINDIVNNIYFEQLNINLDNLKFLFNSRDLVERKD